VAAQSPLEKRYAQLSPHLSERQRRLVAAADAQLLGRGGISRVAAASGLSRTTIHKGVLELQGDLPADKRVREAGGGRKQIKHPHPAVLKELEPLVAPTTRGDPRSPLRWTCKSTSNLAAELRRKGYAISARTVARFLHQDLNYSLQANRKTKEGSCHPDRNAPFEYIAEQTRAFQQRGQPVISVDTKKKELVGEFQNGGREWQPKRSPEAVQTHDFPDKEWGKGVPYGVYEVGGNRGWVSVGLDPDTAEFATATISRWWRRMGSQTYPEARELLIMADSGGSNSSRTRLWKVALQRLADPTGLRLWMCHFPPGTSKWNKIEHRMFCHITANWRGKPLTSHEVIVNLIGNTKTRTGLTIQAELDTGAYPTGIQVSDQDLAQVCMEKAEFHGEWNYRISPHPK
jgi:Rhodopirellula transposase DDE domain